MYSIWQKLNMKTITTLLFSGWISIANSQTNCDCFERLSNLSDFYYRTNKAQLALSTYSRALKFLADNSWSPQYDLTLAKYNIANSNLESAQLQLESAIMHGLDKEIFYFDSTDDQTTIELYFVIDSSKVHLNWNKILKTKRNLPENFNWEYYSELNQIMGIDQSIRNPKILGKAIKNPDSTYRSIDSLNFTRLVKLTKEFAFPSLFSTGFHENGLPVVYHASLYSDELYNQVLDYLDSADSKCYLPRYSSAQIIDRRRSWLNDQPQLFGTWNLPGTLGEIEDIESVDKRRFDFNLLSLGDWLETQNLENPKAYKEMDYPVNYFCEEIKK